MSVILTKIKNPDNAEAVEPKTQSKIPWWLNIVVVSVVGAAACVYLSGQNRTVLVIGLDCWTAGDLGVRVFANGVVQPNTPDDNGVPVTP